MPTLPLRTAIGGVALTLAALAAPASAAPSDDFALGHWKLTLPVDGSGHKQGTAAEMPPSMLTAGYQSIWFHSTLDGALEFWAPVDGATTSGSDYPRSELRELPDPRDDNVNWALAGTATLTANCRILRVPGSTGKVVIGQVHAFDGPPLVKLRYQYQGLGKGGRLDALVNVHPTDAGSTAYPLASGIVLDQAFDYRIAVRNGVLTMQAADGAPVTIAVAGDWQSHRFYFKAGVYVQANGERSGDGGRVRFQRLDVTH